MLVPNSSIQVNFEALNRSTIDIDLVSLKSTINNKLITKNLDLTSNKKANFKETITINSTNFSDPYWLKKDWSLGMYNVSDRTLIGNPETPKRRK